MPSVLILGDSTSTTIGLERHAWPFLVASVPAYPPETIFWNASIAGFTAADACRYYFRFLQEVGQPDLVILSLGNCDACGTELPKGRFTPWKSFALDTLKARRRRPAMRNRLRQMAFVRDFDLSREQPENPRDFAYNIERIAADAQRRGSGVMMINPLAHKDFPAGLGKGNFLFYRTLGFREPFSAQLADTPALLVAAMREEEEGRLEDALVIYDRLLASSSARNPELAFVARHNIALLLHRLGRTTEGIERLRELLAEPRCRPEIVQYNLARLLREAGRTAEAEEALERSAELDIAMYRVKAAYREAVSDVAARRGIGLIDVADIATDDDFIDHCHLAAAGHQRLAAAVGCALRDHLPAGPDAAGIRNRIFNPEYAFGDDRPLIDYFNLGGHPTPPADIAAMARARLRDGVRVDEGQADREGIELARTLARALEHPLFPSPADLEARVPDTPREVGRIPEIYLFRIVLPYIVQGDSRGLLDGLHEHLSLPFPGDYLRALAPHGRVPERTDPRAFGDDGSRLERVLAAIEDSLAATLGKGPIVHTRIKTTIFWYLRESFRFGGHSRLSMLYDGVRFAEAVEALAGSLVINDALGLGAQARIAALQDWMVRILDTHRTFCAACLRTPVGAAWFDDYAAALADLAVSRPRVAGAALAAV
ncbi:tetratricopeptide repeat protein [Azospirillum rugosum]|uniref:Tetratricopeptide (TPR) repeat protein n=1 Tax=Azospirillum rugosum TaxID=416170 RepID=A0ABS4SP32_9PROT|nr:tetratricopeptide repeat protein [Azospirillum rugosum]MBP2294313.1 tetratricopeptide (TPR) repeat protein [Azospirillum rugosum]MDQ0527648.1 tetratricopeptide (TPR) repeat protein [Azospirillum rugosum]